MIGHLFLSVYLSVVIVVCLWCKNGTQPPCENDIIANGPVRFLGKLK